MPDLQSIGNPPMEIKDGQMLKVIMKVIFHPRCLEYEFPGRPESPDRVRLIYEELKKRGFKFARPEPASRGDILLAHSESHYNNVMNRGYSDPDSPPIDPGFPLLSAGCAIKAAKTLGFALTRPPGHHAGREFLGGFCYFNNMAIAVKNQNKKTAILDLDNHHGNGTQNIFLGDSRILYVSIHQQYHYPGTGLLSEQNCTNYPLPAGTCETLYLKTLRRCIKRIRGFRPELLGVSMGFDTSKYDPLGGFLLTEKSYEKIGELIANLKIPTFIVLEGGYSEKIGGLCWNFLKGF